MNPKIQLCLGIFMLVIIFPAAAWFVWRGVRTGRSSLVVQDFRYVQKELGSSRKESPIFFWFTIGFYTLAMIFAFYSGFWAVLDFLDRRSETPNKSLEPTADPLSGLARLPFHAAGSSGCGSALIR
jgi:hypothetical protein